MILNFRKIAFVLKFTLFFFSSTLLPFNSAVACVFHGGMAAQFSDMDESFVILSNIAQARKEGLLEYNPSNEQVIMFVFKQRLFGTSYDGELDYFQAIEGHLSTFRLENGFSYQEDKEQSIPLLTTEMDVLFHLINNNLSWKQAEEMRIAQISGNDKQQIEVIRGILDALFPVK